MNATEVTAKLQALAALVPNSLFLRATDADANKDIDHIDLSGKTIIIYNNLPEINHPVQRGSITREWPVELRILRLAGFDDNTDQGDSIRDVCIAAADLMFDKMATVFTDFPDTLEYQIVLLGEVKVYDKTMTGARMVFQLNVRRGNYYC